MKKDFKTRIAEIAAKIAEQDGDGPNKVTPDAKKVLAIVDTIKNRLEAPLMAINSAAELKDVLIGLMDLIPNLNDAGKRSALNGALSQLAKANKATEPVSMGATGAMGDKMPIPDDLKEAFNRINRR